MKMTSFINGYYRIAEWITRLAYVNILWILFSLLGLIAFGFSPATVALFAVVRKWIAGKFDVPIFKTFWKTFRKDFWKANFLGIILGLIGYIMFIEFNILRSQDSLVYYIVSFGVVGQFILYLIIIMYFFPIYVHFDLKIIDYLKWPFMLGIAHPILTIFLAVVTHVFLYVIVSTVPVLIIFFGGSVMAFILTWGASKTFPNYEM